ncbi:MAG TPA: fused MFS/spermidine synthase [Bryobacteraceae bacterium]|jgi:spermidine synthase|nr:fused MFS/spermidine synthase [Bryobacteraceae bacterium]
MMPGFMGLFPVLLALFAASGCAALIYEIVWFQLLQLVIGSSAVSLGTLLATYMGGMCLGSLAYSRVVSARRHPLRVYACMEAGIGVCGLAVLFGIPWVDRLYAGHAGHGLTGILLRALISACCLLPPTLLMGASLPALARQWKSTPRDASRLGFLYGANTAGAVAGCVLAGFYLLRLHDMYVASYVAVALNLVVALAAMAISRGWSAHGAFADDSPRAAGPRVIYVAIALSGLTALGAEVVWTRLLSLMLGATVYAFSVILAVFLTGLGIGSAVGSYLSRTRIPPRLALGICQLLLAAAVTGTAFLLARYIPYWPIVTSPNAWVTFRVDLLRSACAVLPAACLWGASFPLALATATRPGADPGSLTGAVYAANTAGAIVGALAFSMVLIPWLGTQNAQRVLIALCAAGGLAAIARLQTALPAMALVIAAGLLMWRVPAIPWEVIGYGREILISYKEAKPVYVGEGRNASIAISRDPYGTSFFHISGKVEASSLPQDMRLQRMLGHLAALFHPQPRSVLVVGCGAGVTAGTFVVHPEVERILICELEPLVPPASARHFAKENHHVLTDRRTQIVYDDARHYVLTTPERFDIITSDPIHPWVKGAATLYSREYFEMVKNHLNPGGLVTQWVPLYQSDLETVRSEIATFLSVFPNATIWNNDINGEGYDVVLVGQVGPARIDIDQLEQRLARPDYGRVRESLNDVFLGSALSLLSTYAGRGPDLHRWLERAQINRDRDLRLQYLAGFGMLRNDATTILGDILRYRRFPNPSFEGSVQQIHSLQYALPAWQ